MKPLSIALTMIVTLAAHAEDAQQIRITSYNVCYTKLLRAQRPGAAAGDRERPQAGEHVDRRAARAAATMASSVGSPLSWDPSIVARQLRAPTRNSYNFV